ncbi:hypothetical protein ZWY2020_024867 [Hordeum vulgare]|nr:hypothetical protein ZWY2020_024867 [Hordeum vulgare]
MFTRADSKNILITGGTRFVGLFLSRKLVQDGHQQLPGESDAEYAEFSSEVLHLKGDRKDFDFVKTSLSAKGFNVVYDINVYLKLDLLPHSSSVNRTSIRPVYIYGPLNYNPVEEWFFHRLKAGRPIPIPNAGNQITQLRHVKPSSDRLVLGFATDLATAFIKVSATPKRARCTTSPAVKYIIHYNPQDFDFGKKKAFPFRDQHFFASVEKASKDLGVTPEYDLLDGLTDSYNLNFDRGTFRKEADFTTCIYMILGKKLVSV